MTLNASLFSEHNHSLFTLKTESASWQAELIDVNIRGLSVKGPKGKCYEQFSLTFLVADTNHPILHQAIYQFEHPKMNRFSLFIVPIQKDEQGVYYQAVFNRLVEEQAS